MRCLLACVAIFATGACAEVESSARIEQLRAAMRTDSQASELFWREIRRSGTPLIEDAPGNPDAVLVTFLLQSNEDLPQPVVFASVLPANNPAHQQLERLSHTDIWYRTYRFRRDLPIVYELSGDGRRNLAATR